MLIQVSVLAVCATWNRTSRDRYKNTLGAAGCRPFDSPFPAIVVFLSARASTSFLSVPSLSLSLSLSPAFRQPSSALPCHIFLRLQPFLFCPRRSALPRARARPRAPREGGGGARARVRGGEPYVGLMSAIMT